MGTSAAGVNHRSWNLGAAPSEASRRRKAVWERLSSTEIACSHRSSAILAASSRRHTAAGLPLNGSAVKASTCGDNVNVTAHARRQRRGAWLQNKANSSGTDHGVLDGFRGHCSTKPALGASLDYGRRRLLLRQFYMQVECVVLTVECK
jgi:hypothetical protein